MSEFREAMNARLETTWGEGFTAPGGKGRFAKQVDGLYLVDIASPMSAATSQCCPELEYD